LGLTACRTPCVRPLSRLFALRTPLVPGVMEFLKLVCQIFNISNKETGNQKLPVLCIAPIGPVTEELLRMLEQARLLRVFGLQCPHVYGGGAQCTKTLTLRPSAHYAFDGHELACEVHGGHVSVRSGSWFAGRRLSLSVLVYIFYLLACRVSVSAVIRFFDSIKLHRVTVLALLHDIQVKMWAELRSNHMPTFNPGDELEIDEMWLNWEAWESESEPAREQKWSQGSWVIGLINRARTKLWIECIPNRQRETIRSVVDPMLRTWLLKRPRIFTDALKTYDYLAHENTHYVINKVQDGFGVEKVTFWGNTVKVNVNKVENVWRHLRQHLSHRGAYRHPQNAQLHIAEFVYNWYQLDWWQLIRMP